MKRILSVVLIFMLLCLCGCGDQSAAKETVESFFTEFESGNYDKMKEFCTESCISQFFHENDFFGIEKADLESISDEVYESEQQDVVGIDVQMKVTAWAEIHEGVYADGEIATYIFIMKKQDNKWFIDGITTDPSEI